MLIHSVDMARFQSPGKIRPEDWNVVAACTKRELLKAGIDGYRPLSEPPKGMDALRVIDGVTVICFYDPMNDDFVIRGMVETDADGTYMQRALAA